jgi:hypothetical protein
MRKVRGLLSSILRTACVVTTVNLTVLRMLYMCHPQSLHLSWWHGNNSSGRGGKWGLLPFCGRYKATTEEAADFLIDELADRPVEAK